MIFNMVVLSEYEDESMMGAVTNPLSTWKRDLPKGLNSQGEGQSYFVIRCHGVVSFRQIDTRRDSGLERFAATGFDFEGTALSTVTRTDLREKERPPRSGLSPMPLNDLLSETAS